MKSGFQSTDSLVGLIDRLIRNIENEKDCTDKINYKFDPEPTDQERQEMTKIMGYDPYPAKEVLERNP